MIIDLNKYDVVFFDINRYNEDVNCRYNMRLSYLRGLFNPVPLSSPYFEEMKEVFASIKNGEIYFLKKGENLESNVKKIELPKGVFDIEEFMESKNIFLIDSSISILRGLSYQSFKGNTFGLSKI